MYALIRSLATAAGIATLTGCSGAAQPAMLQGDRESYAARPAARGPGFNAAKKDQSTLFVSDIDAGEIRLFPANKKNPAQNGTITQGINFPINIAVDSAGTLYVANAGSNSVTEYPFGATSPSVTLSNSIVDPSGIAVDSAGTVYVTSGTTKNATYVLEFPKGASSPSARVGNFGLAVGLTVDKNDDLYVCDSYAGEIFKVKKGKTKPVNLGLTGLSDPTGAAIDPAGDLYVSNEMAPYAVNAFHPGQTSPFASITDGIAGPYALAFDSKSDLFVGNSDADPGYISAYKANEISPYEKFSNGIQSPAGLAVYPPVGF